MMATAAGNESAFRSLVERWERPVFAFLARMLSSREDARDLAQETFVRVHAQARRYAPRGQFRSWLFRIAGNLARSWLRRRRIVRWLRFEPARHDQAAKAEVADAELERAETRRQVRQAIARLPQRQRQALILRRYHEMSYAEIARTLGTTTPGVESLLRRAFERLREEFTQAGLAPARSPTRASPDAAPTVERHSSVGAMEGGGDP